VLPIKSTPFRVFSGECWPAVRRRLSTRPRCADRYNLDVMRYLIYLEKAVAIRWM
jgi:hypothetical protein